MEDVIKLLKNGGYDHVPVVFVLYGGGGCKHYDAFVTNPSPFCSKSWRKPDWLELAIKKGTGQHGALLQSELEIDKAYRDSLLFRPLDASSDGHDSLASTSAGVAAMDIDNPDKQRQQQYESKCELMNNMCHQWVRNLATSKTLNTFANTIETFLQYEPRAEPMNLIPFAKMGEDDQTLIIQRLQDVLDTLEHVYKLVDKGVKVGDLTTMNQLQNSLDQSGNSMLRCHVNPDGNCVVCIANATLSHNANLTFFPVPCTLVHLSRLPRPRPDHRHVEALGPCHYA